MYTCQSCGHTEPKWLGRCPECGTWNSFAEAEVKAPTKQSLKQGQVASKALSIPLSAVESKDVAFFDSGMEEINRVLGGGIMKGSSVLIGGEPGIGKSTLVLQVAASLHAKGRVLYVSGEESAGQLRMRADRLGIAQDGIEILCETELYHILKVIDQVRPVLVIVDSIQTIYAQEQGTIPGTVTQIKLCAHELNDKIKASGSCLFLIGHVTKEGAIAGPKVVEHLVDTVLYFDQSNTTIRLLRATKNRFGSVDELGIFEMTEKGLVQVTNPASLFMEHREGDPPSGVAIAPVYEGSRVLLVELQSLVVPAKGGISRVFSDRIDSRRVSRMAAVLEKHLNLPFSDLDIYVNVAGGMRLAEVGIDLPLAMALYTAKTNLTLPANTVVVGEVSLAGEIRTIPYLDRRIKSVVEMGFNRVIGPPRKEGGEARGVKYKEVSTLKDAVRAAFVNS
jgi:DNA repair protein RadA/Sms